MFCIGFSQMFYDIGFIRLNFIILTSETFCFFLQKVSDVKRIKFIPIVLIS